MSNSIRLYNAGDRISEVILYSLQPANERGNWLARYAVDAPAENFFEIPTEMSDPLGNNRVPVNFAQDFARKHGKRGVVLIDERTKTDVESDLPFASNDEDAIEKGNRLWMTYLVEVANAHIQACADARAAGLAPRPASHFTRRAMKLTRTADPGERIFLTNQQELLGSKALDAEAKEKRVGQEIELLKEQLAEQKRLTALAEKKLAYAAKAVKEQEFEAVAAQMGKTEKQK